MEWLTRLTDLLTQAQSAAGALPEAVTGVVKEALPQPLRDTASQVLEQAPVQDLLRQGELPAQWLDAATRSLDAIPKEPGGFLDQGMAMLKERLKS